MTTAEFSAELDTIYENINKNGAPGLDGYEKSVIATHAQELYVVQGLQTNPVAFPQLVQLYTTSSAGVGSYSGGTSFPAVSNGTNKVIQILNELVLDNEGTPNEYTVIPLHPALYDQKAISPYKYPPRRRAWRIELENSGNKVEIIGRPNITLATYKARYIKKPKPIVLENLTNLSPFAQGIVESWTIEAGGSGYSLGDQIVLVMVPPAPVFEVTGVSGGAVTSVVLIENSYGLTDNTVYNTTSTPSAGRSGLQLRIQTTDAHTIDGEYLPSMGELDAAHHRGILKIAATLAEQYYYDKYGTNGDQRQD